MGKPTVTSSCDIPDSGELQELKMKRKEMLIINQPEGDHISSSGSINLFFLIAGPMQVERVAFFFSQ